jgi:hypothetical protein
VPVGLSGLITVQGCGPKPSYLAAILYCVRGQMQPPAQRDEVRKDYRDRYQELMGVSLRTCPVCQRGHMLVIEVLQRPSIRPPITDTS